jgi:hypothetical protein
MFHSNDIQDGYKSDSDKYILQVEKYKKLMDMK